MEFAQQMKTLRTQSGLTQQQMADRLGVTRQSVSNWERGANLPDIGILIAISDEFHVSLDQLIKGKDGTSEMKQKVIRDGSESHRAKINLATTAVGAVLMLAGMLCAFIKMNSVEYVDAQGILHENFFLVPMAYAFVVTGAVVIVVSAIGFLRRRKGEAHMNQTGGYDRQSDDE